LVDWVWENYPKGGKSPEKESAKKDTKGANTEQKKVTGMLVMKSVDWKELLN